MQHHIPKTFTLGYGHNPGDFSVHTLDMKQADFAGLTDDEARLWAQEIYDHTVEYYDEVIEEAMKELTFPRYRYSMELLDEDEYESEVRDQMKQELDDEFEDLVEYLYEWANSNVA